MNLEELIKGLAKSIAKTIMKKQESSERINLNDIDSTDILKIILKRLVYAGEYNKAENILFEEINRNSSKDIYEIALDFYNLLLEKSDKELEEGNFSREEIYQGLQDLKNSVGNRSV